MESIEKAKTAHTEGIIVEKRSIGRFLAALRKANGMTQKTLAEKLNVSDKSVSRWEQDECAPDLSLIPVIAEIYGVTSDEILRGERVHRDSSSGEAISEKSEKQIERIIRSSVTQFQVRNLIDVGISVTGLLVAMICNFAFLRSRLGFFLSCVFYLATIVVESVFLILSLSKISGNEFDAEIVMAAKRRLVRGFGFTVSAAICMFAFSLPLAIMGGTHWGLLFDEWLITGLSLGLLAVLMCLAVSGFVSSALVKKGTYSLPVIETESKPMLRRLKSKVIITVTVIIFIVHIVGFFLSQANEMGEFTGTSYDNYGQFKAFMEYNPNLDANDYPVDDEGNEYFEEITGENGEVLCRYQPRNDSVSAWKYGSGEDRLPIVVYTEHDYNVENSIRMTIGTGALSLTIGSIVAGIIIYHKKRKAILSK